MAIACLFTPFVFRVLGSVFSLLKNIVIHLNKIRSKETKHSELSLRFKIKNELKEIDYKRLLDFLKDAPDVSVELFPGLDLGFVSASSVAIVVEGFGYRINAEISFEEPIGFDIYDNLRLDDEMRRGLAVNRRNFRLSRIVVEPADLEKELNIVLKTVERIVNQTCNRFDRLIERTFTINSEWLDSQFDVMTRTEELGKRGEMPRPFGLMHAKGSKEAKERAGDLVSIYIERDKTYLYEDKKVFLLLPRSFAMKLLKLEGSVMMGADQFTDEEREALRKFSMRRYIKTRKVVGKVYYCDLDKTTRKLLLKAMRK